MLCLWFRPAAIALIQPLAWELPYAMGAALKKEKKKKMWLGHRPAAAALIRPLAWELPYAMGAALKENKKIRRRRRRS